MSNRQELLNARRAADRATAELAAIESLPRRKGALVLWDNEVVWRRLGDDSWEGLHASEQYEPYPETYGAYSSKHVATSAGLFHPWTVLKRLPDLPPED